jgi:hypothetical protein
VSAEPTDGLSADQRDLPPGWHLKALAFASVAVAAAVVLAWKTLL